MPGASIVWNLFDGIPGVYPSTTPVFTYQQAFGNGWGKPVAFSGLSLGILGIDEYDEAGDYTGETPTASWDSAAAQMGGAIANIAQGGSVVMSAPAMVGASFEAASLLGSQWATAAIPIVGPIIAGVTIALAMWMARKGPKQKVATTKVVNDIEPLLADNVQGYLNGARTRAAYEQAIQNFQAGWQYVLDNCGQPTQGEPGRRCIAERQEGATPPWGQNWFQLYLDPIRKNPPTAATTSGGGGGGGLETLLGGSTGQPGAQLVPGVDNTLLLLGAAAIAAVVLL